MIPKNKAESDEIRNIIFAFRANMLPEFVGGNRAGRKMTVPNTFDIQYMYNGAENQYLQKISTCVCEKMLLYPMVVIDIEHLNLMLKELHL